ncbi:ABC transporter substrate-binding protein [uncultured Actinomyces sp.]|uniref:ABC transporter substrate-binding protein n=1 Tax=uncultured Actinomyces sp. TaxID=249061 RepID=UPI0037DC4D3B
MSVLPRFSSRGRLRVSVVHAGLACVLVGLAGCGSTATFEGRSSDGAIVVGSQDYYSNEILAETYAQALEGAGYSVQREFRIGQREVYMPEIASGKIDVFPEYTGSLLQYLNPQATQTQADEVYEALASVMPDGLSITDQAEAADQDSYVVTTALADQYGLQEIGDLSRLPSVTLGGNSELDTRPYGPKGLESMYGVKVGFTPIEDSGGALTVKALENNQVQLVDIYSSDPVLAKGQLKILNDPKGLILASRVVPVVSSRLDSNAREVLNRVSKQLGPQDLVEMNRQSTVEAQSASAIASKWLESKGLPHK